MDHKKPNSLLHAGDHQPRRDTDQDIPLKYRKDSAQTADSPSNGTQTTAEPGGLYGEMLSEKKPGV